CLRAFVRDRALPSGVLGPPPRLLRPFWRLISARSGELVRAVIGGSPVFNAGRRRFGAARAIAGRCVIMVHAVYERCNGRERFSALVWRGCKDYGDSIAPRPVGIQRSGAGVPWSADCDRDGTGGLDRPRSGPRRSRPADRRVMAADGRDPTGPAAGPEVRSGRIGRAGLTRDRRGRGPSDPAGPTRSPPGPRAGGLAARGRTLPGPAIPGVRPPRGSCPDRPNVTVIERCPLSGPLPGPAQSLENQWEAGLRQLQE